MKNEHDRTAAILSAEEQQRMKRSALLKIAVMLLMLLLIIIFGSLGWFAAERAADTSGMGTRVQPMPYTIQTRGTSGHYVSQWDRIGSQSLEWLVSPANNFDNHSSDLDHDETEPGLEPGDSGMLEFRVNPNTAESITVDCVFDFKAYLETPVLDENDEPVLDEANEPVTVIEEISADSALAGYVKAHIMLFSGYENGKYTGLIDTDEAFRRVLADQTYTKNGSAYTTIYWAWPMHLEDLTSEDASRIIYDPGERNDVIRYMAANRAGFFKDCTDTEQQIIADLTALSTAYNNSVYNRYNAKYDNADLEIGNHISYVLLSMNVEQ